MNARTIHKRRYPHEVAMKNGKRPTETATQTATATVVPEHGRGRLLAGGQPGNKGGGRLSNEFKRRIRELVSSEEVLAYLQRCLTGKEGPQAFIRALEWASERGYGKVPNVTKLEGGSEPLQVVLVHRST